MSPKSPISEDNGLKSVAVSLKVLVHHLTNEYVPFTGYLGMLPIDSSSDGFWRRLGRNVRKVILSCAVQKIRSQFPSSEYKGFKLQNIDH